MRAKATGRKCGEEKKTVSAGSWFVCMEVRLHSDSPVVICSANRSAACFMGKHARAGFPSFTTLADGMPAVEKATNCKSSRP